MIPRLFDEAGTVLYVGASDKRFEGSLELVRAGHEITVLEVWEPSVESLRAGKFAKRVTHLIHGDVRKMDELELSSYDFVLWLHGTEHVAFAEAIGAIGKLERLARKATVLSCPWGRLPHGWRENPHNKHVSYWLPDDFARLGYQVACLGPRDAGGGQLLAWKYNEEN